MSTRDPPKNPFRKDTRIDPRLIGNRTQREDH